MLVATVLLTIALLALFLLLLGVMRETVILRGEVTALSQLITRPPAPSFLGKPLPSQVVERLIPLHHIQDDLSRVHIILFFRDHCDGCETLALQVSQAINEAILAKEDISCVVLAHSENTPIFQLAQTITANPVLDTTGRLLDACEVKGTPSQFAVWTQSLQVFDYKLGGDVEWIVQEVRRFEMSEVVSLQA